MSTDLRELMQERSAADPSVASVVRLGQVRQRIARTRRRRRITTALSAALVVLAAITLTPGGGREPSPATSAPDELPLVNLFPDYVGTFQFLAAGSVDVPTEEIVLVVEPSTLMLTLLLRCEVTFFVDVRVNGARTYTGLCDEQPEPVVVDLSAVTGIRLVAPLTFTVTPTTGEDLGFPPESRRPIPPTGPYAIGVYQRVFPAYPLPSPPAELAPLTFNLGTAIPVIRIDSSPAGPAQAVSSAVLYSDRLAGRIKAQAPGLLRIRINGLLVHTQDVVDYRATEVTFTFDGASFAPGTSIEIEVEPEGMTGDWAVLIVERPPPVPADPGP